MKRAILAVLVLIAGTPGAIPAAAQQDAPVWQQLPLGQAQSAPADQGTGLLREELEKLVAPVALYPDILLSQVLPASTFPLDIVQAARWLRSGPDMQKLQDQKWNQSVLALCNYPDILYKMDEDLDWTNALGAAFLEQQQDVMNTIQDLRRRAQAAGALKSTPQQTVSSEQGVVAIAPAQPETIYIPVYNPQVVYAQPAQTVVVQEGISTGTTVAASAISFGVGLALGAWLNTDCDWHHGGVIWCQPGSWHGYAHGGVAWGPERVAAWSPNRAMIAGPNGGAYFGPRGATAWGNGSAWARPTPYGKPTYGGRYASYNQYNRGSINSGNTINVNRNNVNIDRGDRTNISTGSRTNVNAGDRTSVSGGNRANVSAGDRTNIAGGGKTIVGTADRSNMGGNHPPTTPQAGQRPMTLGSDSGQMRQNAASSGGGSSSFGDTSGRVQTQHFSNRGAASRGGGFSGGRSGGGFGGGGARGGGRR